MKLEYQHAILSYFIFLFRLLMAKSGKNLTVRRWHHSLMPESKGKQPWLLISRTLVWWMRTSAAAPYSSTLMVLMQEIRYVFFFLFYLVFFLGIFPAHLHCSPVTLCIAAMWQVFSLYHPCHLHIPSWLLNTVMFSANKKEGGKHHMPFAELTLW